MKEIHLTKLLPATRIGSRYYGAPDPMYICHSSEEMIELSKKVSISEVFRGVEHFQSYFRKNDLLKVNTEVFLSDRGLWISTGEKFIPDYFDENDNLIWKLDAEGKVIPTDGCYIQLVAVFIAANRMTCYTSSGVFELSLSRWGFSAGVKSQYLRDSTKQKSGLGNRRNYEEELEKFLNKKTAVLSFTRIFHAVFNPLSEYYGKPEEAVRVVLKNYIKKKDRSKVIESELFKKTLLKEMSILMPTLAEAFKNSIPDEHMVDMALKIFNKALEKGTVRDSWDSFQIIHGLRENETPSDVFNRALPSGENKSFQQPPSVSLLANSPKAQSEREMLIDGGAEPLPATVYEDEDLFTPEGHTKPTETQLKALREETGAIDEYVQRSAPTKKA